MAPELIAVIRLLRMKELREVSLEEVKQAAEVWAEEQRSNPQGTELRQVRQKPSLSRTPSEAVRSYTRYLDVGKAILKYLTKARPQTSCRNVFVTLRPPARSIRPPCTALRVPI
jgi:hypothetical protein